MKSPSGKFVLRVGPELHLGIQRQARAQNLSLNQFILNTLQNAAPELPVTRALKRTFGEELCGIILFGSIVRGEEKAYSDIDLLIVLAQSRPIDRALYRIWDDELARELDPRYSPQFSHLPDLAHGPSSLWLEVALEGEILFTDPSWKLKRMLQEIRTKIAAGEFVRKISHGHPYWVRGDGEPGAK